MIDISRDDEIAMLRRRGFTAVASAESSRGERAARQKARTVNGGRVRMRKSGGGRERAGAWRDKKSSMHAEYTREPDIAKRVHDASFYGRAPDRPLSPPFGPPLPRDVLPLSRAVHRPR